MADKKSRQDHPREPAFRPFVPPRIAGIYVLPPKSDVPSPAEPAVNPEE